MSGRLMGIRIALLGGDGREIELLRGLAAEGATIKAVAYPQESLPPGDVEAVTDPLDGVDGVDVVIAPMSNTDQDGWIKSCPLPGARICLNDELCSRLAPGTPLLIGMAKPIVKELARRYELRLVETAEDDVIAILNSIPTAEGAVQLAMERLPVTIHGSTCVVVGFGRCGATLGRLLAAMGAEVVIVARNPVQLARAREMCLESRHLTELSEVAAKAQVIFNTVPHLVITEKVLEALPEGALVIDLASHPGGTDFAAARRLGIEAELALGLPGKVAPLSAGRILAETYPDLILRLLGDKTGER
ncbi:MAG: dipicolinate synthase subunit DpsA [Firmicutes bacterium]|jgi:dipicolinate synthase subunit A|nr:dipicolinate synthase subunit DpsA [Bacillota bacterium]